MKHYLTVFLSIIFITVLAQDEEVEFRIGRPALELDTIIIPYKYNLVIRDQRSTMEDWYLYVMKDTVSVQTWTPIGRNYIIEKGKNRVVYTNANSTLQAETFDSIGKSKGIVTVFSLTLNATAKKGRVWSDCFWSDTATQYETSRCSDTNAVVIIDSISLHCYKVESSAKLQEGLIIYNVKSTTYIEKSKLLVVWEQTEKKVINRVGLLLKLRKAYLRVNKRVRFRHGPSKYSYELIASSWPF